MAPFKDESIIIIEPGSHTTLAQLGLPESFTPARLRVRSCMFKNEKDGLWEPFKLHKRTRKSHAVVRNGGDGRIEGDDSDDENVVYEEDPSSVEGAVWPLTAGSVSDWSCFFALLQHTYNALNPPFHTPILLIADPQWKPREHEKLTQFFFEKIRPPAFTIIDAAQAVCYGYGLQSATVVDVGTDKASITAVADFLVQDIGRGFCIPDCGGEVMTQKLFELLGSNGFTRDMCEQLKKSPICEILPSGTPLPGAQLNGLIQPNPAAAASTGAEASGQDQRYSAGSVGGRPHGPREDTEAGDDLKDIENEEGVVDVASIVASGKMNEYLARKEKEKIERAAARKKAKDDGVPAQNKPVRLKNSERETNTFMYEDPTLQTTEPRDPSKSDKIATAPEAAAASQTEADAQAADATPANGVADAEPLSPTLRKYTGTARREVSVGVERFFAATSGILDTLADSIHTTVLAVPDPSKRSELWESLIIVGNGSKVRGFKEALLATLNAKYLISPSSATIFTSELPSNLSTPLPTGANTPQHHSGSNPHGGHGVNPLLLAATTASAQTSGQHLHPPMQNQYQPMHSTHSSHGQTPTAIKLAKIPEYFPEWKDIGTEESAFLGGQVAAKVLFVVDQGAGKGYMTRSDYNEQGPSGIHDYCM